MPPTRRQPKVKPVETETEQIAREVLEESGGVPDRSLGEVLMNVSIEEAEHTGRNGPVLTRMNLAALYLSAFMTAAALAKEDPEILEAYRASVDETMGFSKDTRAEVMAKLLAKAAEVYAAILVRKEGVAT